MTPVDQMHFKDNSDGIPGDCVRACVATILDLPINEVPHFVAEHEGFWASGMLRWCNQRQIEVMPCDTKRALPFFTMATGQSPRGEGRHAVVMQFNQLVHDPHPSRAGLVGIPDKHWLFLKK